MNFRWCLNFSDPPPCQLQTYSDIFLLLFFLNSTYTIWAKKALHNMPMVIYCFFGRPSKVFIHRKYRNVTNILIDCFPDWDLERGLRGDSVPDTITKTLIGWSIEMVTTWAVGWQWTTGNVVPTIKCALWQVGATRLDSSWCSGFNICIS